MKYKSNFWPKKKKNNIPKSKEFAPEGAALLVMRLGAFLDVVGSSPLMGISPAPCPGGALAC